MARPTSRVLALLELLQAGGTHTVAHLAERLAVDERTVRRYVEHLRDLDIPVDGLRGRYGGYRLARHYRMPPLMLTDEEALAVVWALSLTARSGPGPTSSLAAHSASAKVRRVLPASLGRRIEAVLDSITFAPRGRGSGRSDDGQDAGGGHDRGGADVLLALAEAARDRRPVAFRYTARAGTPGERQVQPHGVVAHGGRLYLSGYDVVRGALRTFRLDRTSDVRQLEGTFTVPRDSDPVQQVLGPLSSVPWRHEVSVRIRAEAAHVQSRIPETLASVTPLDPGPGADDGWVRVVLRAERLEWVACTLAVLDRPFLIEHPHALSETVTALAHRLSAAAEASTHEAATAAWAGTELLGDDIPPPLMDP